MAGCPQLLLVLLWLMFLVCARSVDLSVRYPRIRVCLRSSCFLERALAAQLFSTCVLAKLCLYGSFCKTLLLKSCVPKDDACRCKGRAPLGQNPEEEAKLFPVSGTCHPGSFPETTGLGV